MNKLSQQDLQKALNLMKQSNTSNLAKHVKLANELVTKALQDGDVSNTKVAQFLKDNTYVPASHDIQKEENNHTLNNNDVKRWIGTINLVVARAKNLLKQTPKVTD